MSTAQMARLVDEQNRVWKRMCDIRDAAETEQRDLTAEERSNWDAAEKRLTEVSGDIDRLERMAKLDAVDPARSLPAIPGGGTELERADSGDREQRYAEAFDRYLRRGMAGLADEQRDLLAEGLSEVRAQATSPGEDGGYLVPEGFRAAMTEALVSYGGVLNLANVISTATGNPLPWPTNDDTANVGRIIDENTQVDERDVVLGQKRLGAYTYTSRLVRVSLQLLQDSAFNLDAWLPAKLGERIGRAVAQHLVTGTGTNQPLGLVTGGTVGHAGATSATAAVTYTDLVELEHSVDPAYRPRARYVLSDQALKVIRTLRDAEDRPLFVPVPAPGFPATINGFPYTVDQAMPVPAPGAKSLAFGDIQAGYIVRQVRDVQMMRLTERYADYLQVGFLGFSRLDATVDDAAAYRLFEHGAAGGGA